MNEIDFDDWATLYRHDPLAFEARRQALLALELAKVEPSVAAPARIALNRLEDQLAGKDDAQRIQISMIWMAASMRLLSARLQDLEDAIGKRQRTTAS